MSDNFKFDREKKFFIGLFLSLILISGFALYPLSAMEKMTDDELRKITGQKGFFNSEEELQEFKESKGKIKSILKQQGFDSFLSQKTRKQLFNQESMKVEKEVEVLRRASRELITDPEFLKKAADFGKALAEFSMALRQQEVPSINF